MKFELNYDEIYTKNFWRAVCAELFGTTLFLLALTTITINWNGVSPPLFQIALGVGLAIASIVQMIGHVSGGHLNPAVTLGMMVGGRINIILGLFYILAQLIGAVIGSAITYGITPKDLRSPLGVTAINSSVGLAQGFGVEFMFTFVLVFLIFSITDSKKNTEPYGMSLGIGLVIVVCVLGAAPYTGCSLNPARSFGPALIMNSWKDHWVYWLAPLLGGYLAALVYNVMFYVDQYAYQPAAELESTRVEK